MAHLFTKCKVCKKKRLFTKHWTYSGKNIPTGQVTSDGELCKSCHDKINILVLGKWTLKHRINYGIMRLADLIKSK